MCLTKYSAEKLFRRLALNIVNENYALRDKNIFNIREAEYASLKETIEAILIPTEELGFEVTCQFKSSRIVTGEIHRTLKQNLSIKLQKDDVQIDISMQIPKLVDRNYIIINGRRKVPQFQLFDIPVVTRGKSMKIRTNVATIMIFEQKEAPYVYMSILGKKVPLYLIMFGYYDFDVLNTRFNLSNMSLPNEHSLVTMYEKLIFDLKSFYDESRGTTQEDIIKDIGKYYSKYNRKSKGEDLMYALDLILKTDVMSAAFFHTDSILEEILFVLEQGSLDDTLITNKRIRCFEYVILAKVAKTVFDLCLSNRTSRHPKFNVNSTQILSDCNVSDIIQFDFSINPIDELTKLSRTSLVGPNGFNRQNVPEHLRDIMPTMFGRICPVDTPDRDNCGVLQSLVPNVILDDNLRFSEEYITRQPISAAVSMVPFLEHDDQTRLQMASSQMRQSILLQNFDQPLIQSGCESLYTDQTQFIKRAKKDGTVTYLDDNFLIVIYDDKTVDIFDVSYRKIYISNMDVFKIYVKPGDCVKKNDILAESYFSSEGKINIGRNLLTAMMGYYGYNYEDGIVISDRIIKDGVFTSVHFIDLSFTIPPNKVLLTLQEGDYKPLPFVKERVAKGNPYANVKELPGQQQDFSNIFKSSIPLITKHDMIISDVTLFANNWNEEIPQYSDWIKEKVATQKEEEKALKLVIKNHLSTEEATQFIQDKELNRFEKTGKFKMKGEVINGILVEMFGIYFRVIEIGDKIGNRHGNKGVISTIVPHEKMPQLPDGRHVDICINPLGTVSRMNIGQLYELHLSMALTELKKNMKDILNTKFKTVKSLDEKGIQKVLANYLLDFIKIVDKTEGNWYFNQFKDLLPSKITEEFIDDLIIIQPPFESLGKDGIKEALEYTGAKYCYPIFEPLGGTHILNDISVGYMYFFKMVHIAETRLAARGIGSYSKKTLQPLAGRKFRGGQRAGEMEIGCLIGHDAPINLSEFLTTKSDCIDRKNRYIQLEINDESKADGEEDPVPESVKLMNGYLTTIGVNVE